jgi:hypothetical protein
VCRPRGSAGWAIEQRMAPRRNCLDLASSGETAIREAVQAVEQMGADIRLTKAIRFLAEAQASVADFVDDVMPPASI